MKVFGIGVDLVEIKRIHEILQCSFQNRFLAKVLHVKEIEQFKTKNGLKQQSQYLASRWAVKQAVVKAIGRRELVFPQARLQKDIFGKPFIILSGRTNQQLIKEYSIEIIHVSLAHEEQYAIAYAIAMSSFKNQGIL